MSKNINVSCCKTHILPIPVAARSEAWVCGRSLVGIAGSNSAGGQGCLSLVNAVCCQVNFSALGWSLVQRCPTECGVAECDREASIMRRPWPTRGCCAMGKKCYKQAVPIAQSGGPRFSAVLKYLFDVFAAVRIGVHVFHLQPEVVDAQWTWQHVFLSD